MKSFMPKKSRIKEDLKQYMENNKNNMNGKKISKRDIISSLRACSAGDCFNCAFWKGEGEEVAEEAGEDTNEDTYSSCYDELMLTAADELGKIPPIILITDKKPHD